MLNNSLKLKKWRKKRATYQPDVSFVFKVEMMLPQQLCGIMAVFPFVAGAQCVRYLTVRKLVGFGINDIISCWLGAVWLEMCCCLNTGRQKADGSSTVHLSGDGLQQLRGKAFNLALGVVIRFEFAALTKRNEESNEVSHLTACVWREKEPGIKRVQSATLLL